MTARARLDADRTAEPLTRVEHHPPHGGCIGPYMPLVNPEYVDENGKRTPLNAPVLVHFPSDRVGLTWCGLPFDPSEGGTFADYSTDKRGLRFSTDMRLVTCPACDTETPVYPHDLTPSEVALAKMLEALYDPSLEKGEDRAILRMVGQLRREVFSAGYDPRGFTGNALLDRARKAGVQ